MVMLRLACRCGARRSDHSSPERRHRKRFPNRFPNRPARDVCAAEPAREALGDLVRDVVLVSRGGGVGRFIEYCLKKKKTAPLAALAGAQLHSIHQRWARCAVRAGDGRRALGTSQAKAQGGGWCPRVQTRIHEGGLGGGSWKYFESKVHGGGPQA